MTLMLISISALFMAVFAYPYFIYPMILSALPRRRTFASASNKEQVIDARVGLFFCAYNEEKSLPNKIKNIRDIKSKFPDICVYAYSDLSSDNTWNLLWEARDILTAVEARERTGKAAGMRILVDMAECDICIFTDANVILEPGSIEKIKEYFLDPEVGTVAGTLIYTTHEDTPTALAGSAYWRLEEKIKRLESDTGSTMGADGSIFATRKSLYPNVPRNLLDDLIVSISPLFAGYRVISADDVIAYEQLVTSSKEEFRRKRRIACRAFSTHKHLRDDIEAMSPLNKFKYFSHKYIRWFGAVPLTGFLLTIVALAVMVLGWALGGGLVLAGAVTAMIATRIRVPLVSSLVEIALSVYATGWGVLEALGGKDYTTWTPAKSRA